MFVRFLFLLFLISSAFFTLFLLSTISISSTNSAIGNFLPNSLRAHRTEGMGGDVRRRGQFCVLYNFTVAQWVDEYNDNDDGGLMPGALTITLAVHSSLLYIHKLHEQAIHWDGLISAAVLIRPDEQHHALPGLLALWHCSPPLRLRASLHLVWRRAPFDNTCGLLSARQSLSRGFPCPPMTNNNNNNNAIPPLAGALPWAPLRYPINTLRNIARLGAPLAIPLHLVADVENLFSANFSAAVAKLVASREGINKVAFVIRRFELDEAVGEAPESVAQLKPLLRRELAFPFHRHHFPAGHHIPGLAEWLEQSLAGGDVVDMGEIGFQNAAFEPQLIMPANAPLHFEDVPARLYDHQVMIHELCRAGFRLRLLSNVFNVHRGVRWGLSDAEKLIKWIAATQSWKLLRLFRRHLVDKYGAEGDEKCPAFWQTTKTTTNGQTVDDDILSKQQNQT